MNFLKVFSNLFKEQVSLWREEREKAPHILSSRRVRRMKSRFIPPKEVDLQQIWGELLREYFPDRESDLSSYKIGWSARRQKRTLASCNIRKRRVNVAREMSLTQSLEFLKPLLYHEMCHAVLGDKVGRSGTKRLWHGPEFRTLESRHPEIKKLDLWIRSGGWSRAVRSFRSFEYHAGRRLEAQRKMIENPSL